MHLVGNFVQFALDSVGEINDALNVAIADTPDVLKPGRRERDQASLRGNLCQLDAEFARLRHGFLSHTAF